MSNILETYGEEYARKALGKGKDKAVEKFSDFIAKEYKSKLDEMGADSDTVQIAMNFIVEGKFAETGEKGIESKMNLVFDLIENSNSFDNLKDTHAFQSLSTFKGIWDTYKDDVKTIRNSISQLNDHIHAKVFHTLGITEKEEPQDCCSQKHGQCDSDDFSFGST